MSVVIQAHDVWKHYRLGQIGRGTLQRDLESWWAKMRGKEDPNFRYSRGQGAPARLAGGDEFWALRGVSFEIKSGECVGIIGRNGAGKSTLLKILSRVTAPTRGEIRVKGRIASLLEVGTGFHPDLSGRENVFLNGAILGMNKAEIARKLDSIVEFSGCSDFIDTPVKRYSSGMQVRLAFAVAAHLDAEILVIDEVLAVGDADFQKKCLGKMNEVAGSGRTVLFVSHNMGLITSLCQRAILLEEGTVGVDDIAARTVMSYYSRGAASPAEADFAARGRIPGDSRVSLLSAKVTNLSDQVITETDIRQPFKVQLRYQVHESLPRAPFGDIHVYDSAGNCAFVSHGGNEGDLAKEPGIYTSDCVVPGRLLNNGTYFISLAMAFAYRGIEIVLQEKDALSITVVDPIDETLHDHRCGWAGEMPGTVRPWLDWKTQRLNP